MYRILLCTHSGAVLNEPRKNKVPYTPNKQNRNKDSVSELKLQDSTVSETSTAKNLGIWIANCLTMERYVNEVCKSCLYYLNLIRNICSCLTVTLTKTLVQNHCYI